MLASGNELSGHITQSGRDDAGLGRWAWITLGSENKRTRILTVYQPCRSRKEGYTTSYNQQRRYWRSQGISSCPWRLFQEHLTDALKTWRTQGDKIIMSIDGNEDIHSGPLQRSLTRELDMYEAVYVVGGIPPITTHRRGTKQIDRYGRLGIYG